MELQLVGAFVRIANSAFQTEPIDRLREEEFSLVDVDYLLKLKENGYIDDASINVATNVALNERAAISVLEQLRTDPPDPRILENLIDQATDTGDLQDFLAEMGIEDTFGMNELCRFVESLDFLTTGKFNYESDFSFRAYRERLKLPLLNNRKLRPPETVKLLGTSIDLGLLRARKEEELVTFGFAVDYNHYRRLQEFCRDQ